MPEVFVEAMKVNASNVTDFLCSVGMSLNRLGMVGMLSRSGLVEEVRHMRACDWGVLYS